MCVLDRLLVNEERRVSDRDMVSGCDREKVAVNDGDDVRERVRVCVGVGGGVMVIVVDMLMVQDRDCELGPVGVGVPTRESVRD